MRYDHIWQPVTGTRGRVAGAGGKGRIVYPVLLRIGDFQLNTYGLAIGIGFLVSLQMVRKDGARLGLADNIVVTMCFGGLICGLVGARILNIIMFSEQYSWTDPIGWIAIWKGGLVFQGAIPCVLLFQWLMAKHYSISFLRFMDALLPGAQIMQVFGRLGCFFYGCCYGHETTVPWAVRFPRYPFDLSQPAVGSSKYLADCAAHSDFLPSVELWSHPVHPTQLYAASFLVVLCFLLMMVRKHFGAGLGFTLPGYLIFYGIWRFMIEFIRDDNPLYFNLLSHQQAYALLGIALGMILFVHLRRRAAQHPACA